MERKINSLVIGAGFSGAVLARELAMHLDRKIVVIDARGHVGGNCDTQRDNATGIMVHTYGPHIFNTDNEEVWNYVNKFGTFRPFVNRVKAKTARGIFGLPMNLLTINQFFRKSMGPREAAAFLAQLGDKHIKHPANFEEAALKLVGRELYEVFFYGYTSKHWGCDPREIPASVFSRIPVRFNYDDSYYDSRYQGIPEEGYTRVIERILDHERIEVRLGVEYEHAMEAEFDHVFYTGPIDGFFGHQLGRLGYRTVTFERFETAGDYQGNAVINYTELEVPYTRVHEHKHFAPWEVHEKTVAFREFSKGTAAGDVPYYPIRKASDRKLLESYYDLARLEERVSFLGRLGTYRYLDMDDVIAEALEFSRRWLRYAATGSGEKPRFSFDPFLSSTHAAV